MSFLQLKNNAKSTLFADISAGATTLTVVSSSRFPTSGDFMITIWNSNAYKDPGDDSTMEIMKVTNVSGNTFTITRAQESTTAKEHSSGDAVQILFTAGILEEVQDAIPTAVSDLDTSATGSELDTLTDGSNADALHTHSGSGSGDNDKVKISSNDTTEGYLNGKLIAGDGITFTEGNDGGNETLTIAKAIGAFEIDVNGGLMPVTTGFTDPYWELDVNNDLQPKLA